MASMAWLGSALGLLQRRSWLQRCAMRWGIRMPNASARLGGSGSGEEQQVDAGATPLAPALAWRGELWVAALMDEEAA
jgi:hypothetical protein